MSESELVAKCSICLVNDGKRIYVSKIAPESKLICDSCELDKETYDFSHAYEPISDNFHLKLSTKKPAEFIYNLYRKEREIPCFECEQYILTDKMGIGKVWIDTIKSRNIYYCLDCYKKHDYYCVNFKQVP